MADQLSQQIADDASAEEKEIARRSIYLQIEAQFASLEQRDDFSTYLMDETTIYVSDTNKDKDIKDAWTQILAQLDLAEEDEDEDEDIQDEEKDEEVDPK